MTDSRDDRLADDLLGAGGHGSPFGEVLADDDVPRHVVEAALAHAFASRPEDADAGLVPGLLEVPDAAAGEHADGPDDIHDHAPDDAHDHQHDDVLDGHAAAADGWAGEHALTDSPTPHDDHGTDLPDRGGEPDDGG